MRIVALVAVLGLWGCHDCGGHDRVPDATPPVDARVVDARAADAAADAAPDAALDASPDAAEPDAAPDAGVVSGPTPNFQGRVMGLVRARTGPGTDDVVALPGASVRLVDADTRARGAPVTSDGVGRYELPPHPLGTYRVCAEHAGFEPACDPQTVTITADSPYAVRDLDLRPLGAAVVVSLRLADGTPCGRTSTAFGTHVVGHARLLAGDEVVAEADADERGELVLAAPRTGSYRVEGACEDGHGAAPIDLADGAVPTLALTIDDSPPKVGGLTLLDADGQPIRRGRPGQAVRVVAHATDPDAGDALRFRFVDGHGEALPSDGDTAQLTLPAGSAQVLVLAEVADGRGGYGEARAMFTAGDATSRFLGTVRDPDGAPVPGATVQAGGAQAVTDDQGFFRFEAPGDGPFELVASADGYSSQRLSLEGESVDVRITLQPLTVHVVSPAEEQVLQDDRGFVELHLPAGSVVLPRGARAARVAMTGFDPRRPADFPAEARVETPAGDPVQVQLFAAATITITGAEGQEVRIDRGNPPELAFPAPPGPRPDRVRLMQLDADRGVWIAEGEAELDGDVYRARVTHFSSWSVGVEYGMNEACIRVDVDPELLGQFVLVAKVPVYGNGGPHTVAKSWVPTDQVNVVRHLPPFTQVQFEMASLTDPTKVLGTYSEGSYNPAVGPIQYPYIDGNMGCNGWLTIHRYLPASVWLDRIVNTADEGWQYYSMLGYSPDLTLAQWKQQRGFTAQDEADAVGFFNPQEFGLGRRATCHAQGSTVADLELSCCVAKYGHVGGPEHEALDDTIHDTHVGDTVCIEYSHGPGNAPRFTKFLAFKPDGHLSPVTYFDTSGAKAVPGVCAHCHARTQDWTAHGGDLGGGMVFFDAPAYRYADWDAAWRKSAQEERFRKLNRLVKMTHGDTGVYADYIDSLYRVQGVDTAGASASEAPPLPGWVAQADTYREVVRPNCRTCHIWQPEPFAFTQPDPTLGGIVQSYVCAGIMPNAMQPMINVWRRLDPFPGDAIAAAFHGDPCFSKDQPPTVQITAPANGTSLDVGGFLPLHLEATANDAEDGPGCCTLTWTSDRDGWIGAGPVVDTQLQTPGAHVITVTARDSRYRLATAQVHVTATNDPPTPHILFPANDLDSLYRGVPYVLRGDASDPNQLLGLPCDAFTWTSDHPADPFPQHTCNPIVTFQTNGQRVLTLTAVDNLGASAQAHRTINVPDPPLHSPPIVTILNPVQGLSYQGADSLTVRGSAIDPDHTGVVQWSFYARAQVQAPAQAQLVTSGQCAQGDPCQIQFDWTPRDQLGPNCGGYEGVLELRATDADGTSSTQVDFYVAYPPC
jgi:hypothetical protein